MAVTIKTLEGAASVARKTSLNKALSKDAVAASKVISGKALATAKKLHEIMLVDFDAELQTATKASEDRAADYKKWIIALEGTLDNLARQPTLAGWEKAKMGEWSI